MREVKSIRMRDSRRQLVAMADGLHYSATGNERVLAAICVELIDEVARQGEEIDELWRRVRARA